MLDIIIRQGTIVDGTGRNAYRADVGIRGSNIETIGDLEAASAPDVLDATGLCVSPGFIDMHTHSELSLMEDPRGESKIRQGVTTELVGNCGLSPFPFSEHGARMSPARAAYSAEIQDIDWVDLAGYADRINRQGSAINVAPLVGHGSIRETVMGFENREPTDNELSENDVSPDASSVPLPSGVNPSKKSTVPDGAPRCGRSASTVAVKLAVCP